MWEDTDQKKTLYLNAGKYRPEKTPYLNAGKYGPEKTPYLDTLHAVQQNRINMSEQASESHGVSKLDFKVHMTTHCVYQQLNLNADIANLFLFTR